MIGFVKKLCVFLLAVAVLSLGSAAFAGVALPAPRSSGGTGLFEALGNRSSAVGADFDSMGEVSLENLSTVLWAASGLNRPGRGWTVPMAKGMEPYVRIYVAKSDGIFLYDWRNHALKEVSKEDVRGRIGRQNYIAKASCTLILVSDSAALSKEYKDDDMAEEFAAVAAGAMAQNVYLASGALGIGTRYVYSAQDDAIERILNLPDDDEVLCIMPMGARAGS